MNNQTFAMIKPDAIKNGHLGKIVDHILNDNFTIIGLKFSSLSHPIQLVHLPSPV